LLTTLENEQPDSQRLRIKYDQALATIALLEHEREHETSVRSPLATNESSCQVESTPVTISQGVQTPEEPATVLSPSPSGAMKPSQADSHQSITAASEQWENEVTYLNESISRLRQQNDFAKVAQGNFSVIIAELSEENQKARLQLTEFKELQREDSAAHLELQRTNAQLEAALLKAETAEERRSKFLERALARSKESEKYIRVILENEQLASGALRLRLEGNTFQRELITVEKTKFKLANEEVSISTLVSYMTLTLS